MKHQVKKTKPRLGTERCRPASDEVLGGGFAIGKTALVTGGARGIGLGISRELVTQGYTVAVCGRSPAEKTAEAMASLGPAATYFECDISDAASREKMLASVVARFGVPDVLVNNAGVAPEVRADVLEMTPESFDRVMSINLKGPFFLTQAVARLMAAEKGTEAFRCIVNTGSISADYASISRGEYCLSKAAVAMATKLWAVRLAEFGIPVYEVRPGVVHSDMTKVVSAKYDKLIAEGLTLTPRWGEPSDVGRVVASLASGAFAYSTGQVINVDGGMTVLRL